MDLLFRTTFKICLVGQRFKHSDHWYIKLTNVNCQEVASGIILTLDKDF